ncbi:MAG TPA: SRPBCC family protein, partial [Solirubrobacteraceae bacterium]
MKALRPDPVTRDVAAPVERCFTELEDVERYPDWLTGVEAIEVAERDAAGRVIVARVTVRL